jgi:hypothetical protein
MIAEGDPNLRTGGALPTPRRGVKLVPQLPGELKIYRRTVPILWHSATQLLSRRCQCLLISAKRCAEDAPALMES